MRLRVEPPGAKWETYSGVTGPPVPSDGSVMLNLRLQRQVHSNWCWAALAASLRDFYGRAPLRQEDIAAALRVDGDSSARLDDALQAAGCYSHWSPGRPTFERIAHEIAAGRPVCLCIDWLGGGSHYVVISGYDRERRELCVGDSMHGPSVQPFDTFPGLYRVTGGIWRGTYWTAAPAA